VLGAKPRHDHFIRRQRSARHSRTFDPASLTPLATTAVVMNLVAGNVSPGQPIAAVSAMARRRSAVTVAICSSSVRLPGDHRSAPSGRREFNASARWSRDDLAHGRSQRSSSSCSFAEDVDGALDANRQIQIARPTAH
jgi:hypothetical protein